MEAPAMAEREVCANGGFMSTSLQKAAMSGDVFSLTQALECTATNIDAVTSRQKSPPRLRDADLQLVSVICGAQVDAEGRTALMIAAALGHTALVAALCDAGADGTLTNGDGHTAAEIAAAAGHAGCAARLEKEAKRLAAIWGAIDEIHNAAKASTSKVPQGDDLMAKLLAEAGMPAGPKESPF